MVWGRLQSIMISLVLTGLVASCKKDGKSNGPATPPASNINFEKAPAKEKATPPDEEKPTAEVAKIGYDIPADSVARLRIEPIVLTMPLGITQQLKAVAVYTSGVEAVVTDKAIWSTSNTGILNFDDPTAPGLLHSLSLGSADITVKLGETSFKQSITVEAVTLSRVEISPKVLLIGTKQKLYATGIYSDNSIHDLTSQVTWRSTDETIGKFVTDTDGFLKLSGEGPGRVTIYANLGGQGVAALIEVRLKKLIDLRIEASSNVVVKGSSINLKATGTFEDDSVSDVTNYVQWSSIDDTVVTASNAEGTQGMITGVGTGPVQVSATLGDKTVTQDIESILARFASLSVVPQDGKVPIGLFKNYKVYGVLQNGTTQDITNNAVWTTSDNRVAPVTNDSPNKGKVTGSRKGTATVTITYGDLAATLPIEVTNAAVIGLTIGDHAASVICGIDAPVFTVMATMSDNTVQDMSAFVTWTSPNEAIALVSNAQATRGQLQTLDVTSSIKLYAEYHENLTGEIVTTNTSVSVTPPQLVSVEVIPSSTSIPIGSPVQFALLGHYSCGQPVDYTNDATWSSANTTALPVSNTSGSKGFAASNGSTATTFNVLVTATYDTFTDDFNLEIRPEEVISVQLSSATSFFKVDVAGTTQLYATSIYSNGTQVDVTNIADWYVGQNAGPFLSVDNSANKGLITGISEQNPNVLASLTMPYGTFTGSQQIQVQSPCPPGGTRGGLWCFYQSPLGGSCTDACTLAGANSVHTWANDFIGSGDNDPAAGKCLNILRNFGLQGTMEQPTGDSPGSNGLGCSIYGGFGLSLKMRFTAVPTSDSAAEAGYKRICACKHY